MAQEGTLKSQTLTMITRMELNPKGGAMARRYSRFSQRIIRDEEKRCLKAKREDSCLVLMASHK